MPSRKHNVYLKTSVSRKNPNTVGIRQRQKIRSEMKRNYIKFTQSEICKENVQNIKDFMEEEHYHLNEGVISMLSPQMCTTVKANVHMTSSEFPDNINTNNNNIRTNDNDNMKCMKQKLVKCFIQCDLNHCRIESILSVLRSHTCFKYLPKCARTLLQTTCKDTCKSMCLRNIGSGVYLHIGFEEAIINILQNLPIETIPDKLLIDISTDGASEDRNGRIQIWPLQCRVLNICHCKPETIGLYRGRQKPESVTMFFLDFLAECEKLRLKGGISFNNKIIPFEFRAFIADAPARAFVLNHYGHMSYHPCSKCKITGVLCHKGNIIFPSIDNEMRSDKEYRERSDEDHFKAGDTPITALFQDVVTQTPFEYMHLVLLDIVKKTLSAFVIGKYGKTTKLSKKQIDMISNRLNIIVSYRPREFNRKPRPISEYGTFKATECRQLLLYTGVVVLFGIVEQNAYNHFLLLHAIMRCLSSTAPSEKLLQFSELAIKLYVQLCAVIYNETFLSYNVHGLLHLVEDVRRFGSVDNFSAFPYENNMTFYRNTCQKPNQQLQ